MKKKNINNPIIFIFITILIDFIGFGIIIPIIPSLIENLTVEGMSNASMYGGWMMFAYAIMQFLFSPMLGGLSDRFGRRPILLISLLGLGLDYILHAYASTIFWLFIGRIIAGLCGASYTTAIAYVADISTPEKKAQNFGMISVAFGLGFIIGPVLGGILGKIDIKMPFFVAAGFSIINVIYGFFVLPESLKEKNRRKFDWKRTNPIGALKNLNKYPSILHLMFAVFLLSVAAHAIESNWTFFTMYRFDWDEAMVGYSLGFVGILVVIIQGFLIKKIILKIGEKKTIYLGFIMRFIAMLLFAFASKSWMIFVFLIPYSLGGLSGPTLQAFISNRVSDKEQGELQGLLSSLTSISTIFGPLIMTQLFFFSTKNDTSFYFPGAPFILAALLVFLAFFFISGKLNKTINEKHSYK